MRVRSVRSSLAAATVAAVLALATPALAAQPDPSPTAGGALGGIVHQAVEDPAAPTRPLPPGAFDQAIRELRQWTLAHQVVLAKFQAADPAWRALTWNDLHRFALQVCAGRGTAGADTLLARIPGVQLAQASLLTEAVALVPLHCTVTDPRVLDEVSNALLGPAYFNTIEAGRAAATEPPAAAVQNLPSGLSSVIEVGCATGAGLIAKKVTSAVELGRFRFADLLVAATAAVGTQVGGRCAGVLTDAVQGIQAVR
ncbi:hypothetical protein [Streptomyces sp. NPDC089919]|uniref:hypothetical protein n=1 Tax=Streptomyces sp. NPDC089919 TaxID=3155188 RepID=UPI00341F6C4F